MSSRLWTPPDRPEQLKRPEHPYRPEQLKRPVSGRFDTGQSTRSVQLWTPSNRPEKHKRPDSGRFDTSQSTRTVQILDALLGSNCVVF